jgi:hypothetical protein
VTVDKENWPMLVHIVHQTIVLGFLIDIVRERFAKVREQYLPNPCFRLSSEHRSLSNVRVQS